MKLYEKTMALATVAFTLPVLAAGRQEVTRLAPVSASLTQKLDAKRVHDGDEVQAKLRSAVHLTDGTELPSGTLLIGHVVQDDMQEHGVSKLALRFDQADLKDGKVVPIKATLVGISQPTYDTGNPGSLAYEWSPGIRQIDQIDALPGVDLHSQIASKDSGVLVSSKNDVRLDNASQLEFAIGPQSGA